MNLNLHYDRALPGQADAAFAKRLSHYVELRNVLDRVDTDSAQNLADTLNPTTGRRNGAAVLAATGGTIHASAPRNVVAGMKRAF
ncbi:hypothetical protein LOK46_25115 [Methylobacterium sp. NMS14P]|uniref:hypothetical protein n=1 Tax=Methylobacterium sp. NMS14P TaxID=2894310 RepID=UPI00235924DF|nr:hypothetical protein [Methylobacterium sp. NMS14P]WCS24380.1 hypothetical protein LOK46_25115 [Methylobacterium sp. NMS14P]